MSESHLNCTQCSKRFNLDSREPIFLDCCYQAACKECLLTKMSLQIHPQEDIIQQVQPLFTCSLCKKSLDIVPSKPIIYLKEMIK